MNLADDVDASRFEIGVDGGTVAPSGEVDTWRQWRLAVELAYDACVVDQVKKALTLSHSRHVAVKIVLTI